MSSTDVPYKYEDLYYDEVDGRPFAYNPISSRGIVVLDPESKYILDQIDGKKSVQDIFKIVKKVDSNATDYDVTRIIDDLISSRLIYNSASKLDSINKRDAKNDGKLLRVWIHLTNQCNLRCLYCFVGKTNERMDLNTGVKSIRKLIREAKYAGYEEIVCNFGGGEPLLEWGRLVKIVNRCKSEAEKMKISLRFGIITNATLINPKIAKVLKQENMFVAVSMDGLGKYQNIQRPYVNGQGSFREVSRGIKILRDNNIVFNIISIITSLNVTHLPKLTRYSMENDIPISYGFYKDSPHSENNLTPTSDQLIKYFKLSFKEISKNPPKYTIMHGLLDMIALDYPHIHPCRAGRHYLVLRHDRKISFCSVTVDQPTGTLTDHSSILKVMKKGNFLEPKNRSVNNIKECQNCPWRYACCGGCPLITYKYKRTYNSNSPLCSVFKTLIPELLKVEAKRLIACNQETQQFPPDSDMESNLVFD